MTNETPEQPYTRKVILTVPRKHDLDLRVSRVVVHDGDLRTYADVREFIPSLGQYGRGVLLPVESLESVIRGLQEVSDGYFEDEGH